MPMHHVAVHLGAPFRCRQFWVSDAIFYKWHALCGIRGAECPPAESLEDGNRNLKRLPIGSMRAVLTLKKVLAKNVRRPACGEVLRLYTGSVNDIFKRGTVHSRKLICKGEAMTKLARARRRKKKAKFVDESNSLDHRVARPASAAAEPKYSGHRTVLAAMPCAVAIVITLLFSNLVAADPHTLTIAYPPEKNAFHDAAAAIIRKAYQKLGIAIVFKTLPGERSLQLSNDSVIDGELVRVAGIAKLYANLIRIPVSHVTAEQMAFGRDATIVINGWQSLAHYKLAFHRGYKVAEENTKNMNRYETRTDQAAFRMVASGRMDLALANRFTGEKVIRDLKLTNVVMLRPPVEVDPLFHYLNKKHAELVPQITAVLRRMEADGEIKAIRQRYGASLLGTH
jgi:polar amino acid transport system substrate-binding protein